jgi:hypothetical protein
VRVQSSPFHTKSKLNFTIQVSVFWHVTPCSVAVGYRRFGGPCYLEDFVLNVHGREDFRSWILLYFSVGDSSSRNLINVYIKDLQFLFYFFQYATCLMKYKENQSLTQQYAFCSVISCATVCIIFVSSKRIPRWIRENLNVSRGFKIISDIGSEIHTYNNKHSLRSNTKGYGGKTH